jgi:hypothetical protein
MVALADAQYLFVVPLMGAKLKSLKPFAAAYEVNVEPLMVIGVAQAKLVLASPVAYTWSWMGTPGLSMAMAKVIVAPTRLMTGTKLWMADRPLYEAIPEVNAMDSVAHPALQSAGLDEGPVVV